MTKELTKESSKYLNDVSNRLLFNRVRRDVNLNVPGNHSRGFFRLLEQTLGRPETVLGVLRPYGVVSFVIKRKRPGRLIGKGCLFGKKHLLVVVLRLW